MRFVLAVSFFILAYTCLPAQNEADSAFFFCPEAPVVKDHEGNVYSTVKIGRQCWMAENMRCTTSPTGKTWLKNPSFSISNPLFAAYYAVPVIQRYGLLYNWAAAMDTYDNQHKAKGGLNHRGICPLGWHLPDISEWETLFAYLGGTGIAGEKMKAMSQLWEPYTANLRDVGGFNATPAGSYTEDGYRYSTQQALFWSATPFNKIESWCAIIYDFKTEIYNYLDYKCYGHSVRCVKD